MIGKQYDGLVFNGLRRTSSTGSLQVPLVGEGVDRFSATDVVAVGSLSVQSSAATDCKLCAFYENMVKVAECVTLNKNKNDQKDKGANLEYLSFFLEDDAELEHIKRENALYHVSGVWRSTGAVKIRLIQVLTELVERHRRARAAVTKEMVNAFMAVRPLPSLFE